jgi:hypothetical protein
MGESGLEIPNSQSLKEDRRDASRFQLRMEIKFVVEVSIRDWLTMHLDSAFFYSPRYLRYSAYVGYRIAG